MKSGNSGRGSFGKNFVAGLLGDTWGTVLSLVFVPTYIKYLGMESYGLIGVYTMIQSVFTLFDFGLSTSLNRELARLSNSDDDVEKTHNLVRTIEILFWLVAGAIVVISAAAAPLGVRWVNARGLSDPELRNALCVIGLVISMQWPLRAYRGGLYGMQRHVLSAVIVAAMGTLRSAGAVVVLAVFSPTIHAFFFWQAGVAVLETLLTRMQLMRALPVARHRPRFEWAVLARVWRFAAGMSGYAIVSLLLTQADKILLTSFLTLEQFSYYSLAGVAAGVLYRLRGPISRALVPGMARIVAAGDVAGERALYHRGSQLVAVLVIPPTLLLCAFGPETIWVWTGNAFTADISGHILELVVLGTGLNSLLVGPYAAQLAYGWTSLVFLSNLAALAIVVPALLVVVPRYGALGAAAVWAGVNLVQFVVSVNWMHQRILRGEKWRWYFIDNGAAFVAAGAVILTARLFMPHLPRLELAATLTVVGVASMVAAIAAAPEARRWAWRRLFHRNDFDLVHRA